MLQWVHSLEKGRQEQGVEKKAVLTICKVRSLLESCWGGRAPHHRSRASGNRAMECQQGLGNLEVVVLQESPKTVLKRARGLGGYPYSEDVVLSALVREHL